MKTSLLFLSKVVTIVTMLLAGNFAIAQQQSMTEKEKLTKELQVAIGNELQDVAPGIISGFNYNKPVYSNVDFSRKGSRGLLFDNGPIITHAGGGPGGSDYSLLQNPPNTTLGFGYNKAAAIYVADDFTATEDWAIDSLVFFGYQTGSTLTSTFTGIFVEIWNGDPGVAGSAVVWGDLTTNLIVDTYWSNCYRGSDLVATNRPIMGVVAGTAGLNLPAGDYWLVFAATGSTTSGPWCPPITILDQPETGNALQSISGVWAPLIDGGSLAAKGLPFIIYGNGGVDPDIIYATDFESFVAGQKVACQDPVNWTTWSNAPCGPEDAYISETVAHSPVKSVVVENANDLVLLMGNKTTGKYELNFNMYMPTGFCGYYNVLQNFAGGTSTWGLEVYFHTDGSAIINAGGNGAASFNYAHDVWIPIKNVVDLDSDLAELIVDGVSIYSWQWSLGATGTTGILQLGAADFFVGADANYPSDIPLYYFDDVEYKDITEPPVVLNPPRNLAALVSGQNVHLTWDPPLNGNQLSKPNLAASGAQVKDGLSLTGIKPDYSFMQHNKDTLSAKGHTLQGAPGNNNLLNYTIYRDGTPIAEVPASQPEYWDMNLAPANYSYTATAGYALGESVPTDPVEITVEPGGITIVNIGDGTELPGTPRTPFDFYWMNSLCESLYFPEEIQQPAGSQILQVEYHNNFVTTGLIDKPIQIWMGETSLMNLTGGYIPAGDLTLVFDGTVDFPAGVNDINIPLQTPYTYGGGNLVILTYRVWENIYWSSSDRWYSTTTPNHPGRTLGRALDATLFDPFNPPADPSILNLIPNTTLYIGNGSAILEPPFNLTADLTPLTGQVDLNWNYGLGSGFYEDFNDGIAQNFQLSNAMFTVSDGYLKLIGDGNNMWSSAYYDHDYQDFVVETSFQRHQGGQNYTIGLFIRSNGYMGTGSENGYLLSINTIGSYSAWRQDAGNPTTIIPWTSSSALNTGYDVPNIASIVAEGNIFKIYFNGYLVDQFTDNTYTSGKAGVCNYMPTGVYSDVWWDYISLSTNIPLKSAISSLPLAENQIIGGGNASTCPDHTSTTNLVPVKGLAAFLAPSYAFEYFNIYRDGILINTTAQTSYTDMLPDFGTYEYGVSAHYAEGESDTTEVTVNHVHTSNIVVEPTSLVSFIAGDLTDTQSFRIKNTGNAPLTFYLTDEENARCLAMVYPANDGHGKNANRPDEQHGTPIFTNNPLSGNGISSPVIAWLNENPLSGSVAPGDSTDITVIFDAAGVAPGTHAATIKVHSNAANDSLVLVQATLHKSIVNLTTDDNENNPLEGIPDYDMDVYLYNTSPLAPVEFNIFINETTINSAQLNLFCWDVDWVGGSGYYGERDQVWFNGHYLGYLTGANGEWSTTIFNIDPAWVIPGPNGKNLVQIYIDEYNEEWAVTVDWGQLILNGSSGEATIRYVNTDKPEYLAGEPVQIAGEADADPPLDVRVETNLINPDNQIIAGTTTNFTATTGDEPYAVGLTIPLNAVPGTYQVMTILYDAITNIQQDIEYTPFQVVLGYCTASGGCDEHISGVQAGDIDNTGTPCSSGGYHDYTYLSTTIGQGQSIPVTVTNGNPSYSNDQCGIWIDWNQDLDFLDPDEYITMVGSPGIGPYTANIIAPYDATEGETRMRVRIKYTGTLSPCGAETWGETEDYTIVVVPGNPVIAVTPGSFFQNLDINTQTVQALHIANTGGETLNFTIEVTYPAKAVSIINHTSKFERIREFVPGNNGKVKIDDHFIELDAKKADPLAIMNSTTSVNKHVPAFSRATVYVNQTGNPSSYGGIASQTFEPANSAYSCAGADDFIVPAGATWSVNHIFAGGTYSTGYSVPAVNVIFFDDNAGLPGAQIATFTGIGCSSDPGGAINILLPSSVMLTEGHYWISVAAVMDYTTHGQWFWSRQTDPQLQNQFTWQNPGGGFAGCTSWCSGSVQWPSQNDYNLTFALSDSTQDPPPTGWLSANPLTGTISPGDAFDVLITFDAADLNTGTYQGLITINSNDPVNPVVEVPATLGVREPLSLPFFEDWSTSNYGDNGWRFDNSPGNWSFYANYGNPPPAAMFVWIPTLSDYSSPMISPVLNGTEITDNITLQFDIYLNNFSTATVEGMAVEVFDGSAWQLVHDYTNMNGSFPFLSETFNITPFAGGQNFSVRFRAYGENSFNINYWMIDNIMIFRQVVGSLSGVITRLSDGTPVEGALITIDNGQRENHSALSGADGLYNIPNVIPGDYVLTVEKEGFNLIEDNVVIIGNETVTENYALTAPVLGVDPTALTVTIPIGETTTRNILISNTGDGPVAWSGNIYSNKSIHIPASDGNYARGQSAVSNSPAPKKKAFLSQPLINVKGSLGYACDFYSDTFFSFNTDDPSAQNVISIIAFTAVGGTFDAVNTSFMYVIDLYTNILMKVNTVTGAASDIGTANPVSGHIWSGITVDKTTNIMYGISTDTYNSYLYYIDMATGLATAIGPTGTPGAIDCSVDGTGQMYSFDVVTDAAYKIDKATGASTLLGSIGFDANYAQGMGWDPATDIMYLGAYNNATGGGELRILDRVTGNTAIAGNFGTAIDALAFPGAVNGNWASIDPTSGNIPAGESQQVTVTFDGTYIPPQKNTTLTGTIDFETDPGVGSPEVALQMTLTGAFYGILSGMVTHNGVPLPGVTVKATRDESPARVYSMVTGADGSYLFPATLYGTYYITAEKTGFNPYASDDGVKVVGDQTTLFNFELLNPAISITPASLSQVLQQNTTATQTLTIGNTGGSALDFTIDVSAPVKSLRYINHKPQYERVSTMVSSENGTGLVEKFSSRPLPESVNPSDIKKSTSLSNKNVPQFAPSTVYYNQTGNPSSEGGVSSQTFSDFPDYSCAGADDFIVPAGETWNVNHVFVNGTYYNGFDVPAADIIFYSDASGYPGTAVVAITNVPALADATGNLNIFLPSSVTLSAGHYWMSVAANMDFATYGQWFWSKETAPTLLNELTWQNPGGGFAGCTSWCYGSVQWPGIYDHNLSFVLTNASGPVPWLTVDPVSGTVPPGGSVDIEVTFDATSLINGAYAGQIMVSSNDSSNPVVSVPATLAVHIPVSLPFNEDWSSGGFAYNDWTFDPDQSNWIVTTNRGNPAPTAEFYYYPTIYNYSKALVTPLLDASAITDNITLNYDILLNNFSASTLEGLAVEVFDGNAWQMAADYTNANGSIPWTSVSLNITSFAADHLFIVRFRAYGENSFTINWWDIDNVMIYRQVVGNLTGTITRLSDGLPVEDALITIDNGQRETHSALSGADGLYIIPNVMPGNYALTVEKAGFNTIDDNAVIVGNETTIRNYELTAPVINVNPASLNVTVPTGEITTRILTISNTGDGPVAWNGSVDAGKSIRIPASDGNFERGKAPVSSGTAPMVNKMPGITSNVKDLLRGSMAYAFDIYPNNYFFSFNTDNPSVPNIISSIDYAPFSGTFDAVNSDFMYVMDYNTNQLKKVEIATGAVTTLGICIPAPGETWTGITVDKSTNIMYGISTNVSQSTLYAINMETGASIVIGNTGMPGAIDLAVDGSGQMYSYDIVNDQAFIIDKATGASTLLGSIGFDANYAQGMGWDPLSDIVFLAAYNVSAGGVAELRVLDRITGNTAFVGNFTGETDGLAFPGGGTPPWLTISPETGIVPPGESQQVTVTLDGNYTSTPKNEVLNGTITFSSDPDVGSVMVPVTLTITPAIQSTMTIAEVTGALPGPVSVPVHATDLNNLGAFQFTIEYDPALMTYTGTSNWYPGISDILIGSATPGILTFIWAASAQGVTITDGTFFNLDFTWLGSTDTSPVAWADSPTQREFSDYNGTVFVPLYTNGGVTGTEVLPHFTTVWSGNPIYPMSIIVTQATLDQVNLAAGDEIGIFDGAICVGAYKLTAPINPNDPPFIIVSKDDPGTPVVDGYTEGHTIDYKIWKQISNFETSSVLHTFPFAPMYVFETFTQNETAVVILSGSSVPVNTTVQNVTIPDGTSNCYNATQTITVAGNGTNFVVQNGGSATMIAGQNIRYLPGTTVQSGGYLWGYIAPNGPYCQTPAMPAVVAGEAELPASFGNASFTIYPNPTTGKFILELKTDNLMEWVNVEIYGLHGEKVQTLDLIGERKHEFSLTDRPDGVYLIRVVMNGKAENKKMIKY